MRDGATEFLEAIRTPLESADALSLAKLASHDWPPVKLYRFLQHPLAEVRGAAAVALGVTGDEGAIPRLARTLHDESTLVTQMAEYALWSLWFRQADDTAMTPFRQGVQLLADEQYESAVKQFQQAAMLDPDFSEAYNQCAMAHFFVGRTDQAIQSAARALELMPCHFGAAATIGHCYAQLGDIKKARRCYQRALRIHPRMDSVHEALEALEGIPEADALHVHDPFNRS